MHPPKALESLSYVQGLHQQLSTLQADLHRSQLELQATHERLKTVRARMQEFKTELEQSRSIISAMESSKFWQLRSLWVRLKGAIGLSE